MTQKQWEECQDVREMLLVAGERSRIPDSFVRRRLLTLGLIAANHIRTPEVAEILDTVALYTQGVSSYYHVWHVKQGVPVPDRDEVRLAINYLVDAVYEAEQGDGGKLGILIWNIVECVGSLDHLGVVFDVRALLYSFYPRVP